MILHRLFGPALNKEALDFLIKLANKRIEIIKFYIQNYLHICPP